jgi:putative transposase
MRDEFLNQNLFYGLQDAQYSTKRWRNDYNEHRPHSSLKNMSPVAFALTQGVSRAQRECG